MSVLEQYGLSVYRTVRGRGAFLCETDHGVKLLRETSLCEEKYAKEDYITKRLQEEGYKRVDTFCRTLEGKLLAEDEDHKRYYLKEWFDAGECDVKNYHHVLRACSAIARMHQYLEKIKLLETERAPVSSGENGKETDSKETDSKETDGGDEALHKNGIHVPVTESLEFRYQRKMREMCSIRNYLRKKKRKTDFERLAYEHLVGYIKEGEAALDHIAVLGYGDLYRRSVEQGCLTHGSCNHHNILVGKGYEAIVNFQRVSTNIPIVDLYDYMRKILEKYQWDIKLAYKMLDEYDRERGIGQEDLRVLICLFSFPEKYFKVMDHYYNSSKAWLPEKDMEKLKVVLAQNEARRRFVESLK